MGERKDPEVEELALKLYNEFMETVKPSLGKIVDETRRYLYLLAWLNKWVEERDLGRIIITGGFAVEVYTGRLYRTMDVDIIVEGYASKILEEFISMFSKRIGRGYIPRLEELMVKSIDIVSTIYNRRIEPVKLYIDNLYVYVESPEELIIIYLSGWKYWGSTDDRDKALWIYIVWRDKLDLEYLRKRALEEKVHDKLKELDKLVEKLGKDSID